MSSRRRATIKSRRGRNRRSIGSRTGGIDLDDLDGALKAMICTESNSDGASSSSTSRSPTRSGGEDTVKVTIDSTEERRFVMHSTNNDSTGIFSSHCKKNLEHDLVHQFRNSQNLDGGFTYNHTSQFAKHQENFSDTKYIKP